MAQEDYADVELVCLNIIDILKLQLNEKILAIENYYKSLNRNIVLEPIRTYYFGEPSEPPLQDLPAISVNSNDVLIEEPMLFGITRDNPRVFVECYFSTDLNSKLIIDGSEYKFFEILHFKAFRYAKAIRQVLMVRENRTLNNSVEWLRVVRYEISPTIGIENFTLKWVSVECEIKCKKKEGIL